MPARSALAGAVALAGATILSLGLPRPAPAQECVTIDDFSDAKVGEFPPGWRLRKDEGQGVYTVREEGGQRFLHADSRGLGIQAAREFKWDLARYPVLAWSWRPVEFPKGADERDSKTNDSALAVYALVPYRMGSVKAVKYVWSAVVPVGTHLTSNMSLTQVRVLDSGSEGKGRFKEQRANVLQDYRRYFKTSDTPSPAGIAVLTDADDTNSRAQGDYANFRACAR